MSLLVWNCRGLGNRHTIRALEKVVTSEDLILIFLTETKFFVSKMEEVKERVKRSQGLVVSSVGRSGGLALLWKPSLIVDIQSCSESHIDAIIKPKGESEEWRFTGFCGNRETSKRIESWQLLKRLSSGNSLPWVCVGDFNESMHNGVKERGSRCPASQMANFCEAINTCQLCDLGYIRQDFTWSRKFGNRGWIRERLDRALVSVGWTRRFLGFQLHHKANSSFDHCILLLKEVLNHKPKQRSPKIFRFKEMWIKEESCASVVVSASETGECSGSTSTLSRCLEECRSALTIWNKNFFGHVGKQIAALQNKLESLECQKGSVTVMVTFKI